MPKKINDEIFNVMSSIIKDFDSVIDYVLKRKEFKLSDVEKTIFKKRIKGIIATESRGKINVKNGSAGEVGIMQIKPVVSHSIEKLYFIPVSPKIDLKNVEDNILIGSLLLYDNYIKSDRDIDLATQRYNQGWIEKTNIKSLAYLTLVKGFENYG